MNRTCLLVFALLTLVGCGTTRPPDHEKAFSSVEFSPDHSLLAFADAREIRVLNVDTRTHLNTLRQLPQDTEGADPMSFRHGVGDTMVFLDNDRIATTGMGGLVSIWDVRSGNRLSVIDPPTAEIITDYRCSSLLAYKCRSAVSAGWNLSIPEFRSPFGVGGRSGARRRVKRVLTGSVH